MTVLVTGATGRIGRHVTERLLQDGHSVRALVMPDDPRRPLIERPGVEFVVGTLADDAVLSEAVDGVDAVVHMAAALTTRNHTDDEYIEANVMGTYKVLAAIRDSGARPDRFVYISSDAVYWRGGDRSTDYQPIDEVHPREPGSVYGVSKLAAEELCLTFWRLYGLPVTIIRPSATADAEELIDPDSVFGARMLVSRAIRSLESSRAGDTDVQLLEALRAVDDQEEHLFVVADPDGRTQQATMNDARDTAAGMVMALGSEAAIGRAFNIGPAGPHDDAELVAYLGQRLGLPVVTVRTPSARADWVVGSALAYDSFGYRSTRTVFQMVDEALAARGD